MRTRLRPVLVTWDIRSERERYWECSLFIFLAIQTSDRWGEGLLHDCVFPGFRTDLPRSQYRENKPTMDRARGALLPIAASFRLRASQTRCGCSIIPWGGRGTCEQKSSEVGGGKREEKTVQYQGMMMA